MERVITLRRLIDSALTDLEILHVPESTLLKVLEASALVRSEELRLANLAVPDKWPSTVADAEHAMTASA